MSPIIYLEALKSRLISFRTLQDELTIRDMPTALGWTLLLKKYEETEGNIQYRERWTSNLEDIYLNHIKYNSKVVYIYELSADIAYKLQSKLNILVSDESRFKDTFPLPVNEKDLKDSSFNPDIFEIETEGEDIRLFSSYKRAFRTRDEIQYSQFNGEKTSNALIETLNKYEEVYGLRTDYAQAIDCIILRSNKNRMEFHIDNSHDILLEEVAKVANYYKDRINKFIQKEFEINECLNTAINFYPKIKKLYEDADGQVTDYGHVTSSASVKHERMKRGIYDLRNEPFHQGGLAAVTTDGYSITKKWKTEGKKILPSLSISGRFSIAGQLDANIDFILINDCHSQNDFDMMLNKLFENA
ncbi:MAG: hypothetical protein HRU78_07945 [Gammaproteobacteria bacterium]|nr:MAG: hypothetical protein HRU78_07945 [Gammaproteobacteria bacterium]